MRGLLHRPAVAFALGALLVAAAVAGRAAHAALGGDVVNACFKPSNGTLYLIGGESGRTACQPGDVPISWNTQGLQGPAGPKGDPGPAGEQGPKGDTGQQGAPGAFSGSFASPNGLYRLTVADAGIRLEGPGGLVSLVGDGIVVDSTDALTLQSATGTSLRSGASLTALAGGALSLRGSSAIQIRADTSLSAEAGTALSLRAASGLSAQAGAAMTAQAGGAIDVAGASVRLNGATCGVLRPTDLAAAVPDGGGPVVLNPLGSPTVRFGC